MPESVQPRETFTSARARRLRSLRRLCRQRRSASFECLESRICLAAVPVSPTPSPLSHLGLVWSDEFTALDTALWHAETDNTHEGDYTPNAVKVVNDELKITTYNEDTTATGGHLYKTGSTLSKGFEFKYGYVEARIKFDGRPGQWSAFWLGQDTVYGGVGDPADYGQEVDIAEVISHPAYNDDAVNQDQAALHIKQNLHWDAYDYQHNHTSLGDVTPAIRALVADRPDLAPFNAANFQNEYHTYGVDWTPQGYTFYIDGYQSGELSSFVSHRAQYIKFSSEVQDDSEKGWCYPVRPAHGFGDPKKPAEVADHATMSVDYVAVYQPVPLPDYRVAGNLFHAPLESHALDTRDLELKINDTNLSISTPAAAAGSPIYAYSFQSSNPALIPAFTTAINGGDPLPLNLTAGKTGVATLTISANDGVNPAAFTTVVIRVNAGDSLLDGGFEHSLKTVETIGTGATSFKINALAAAGNAWRSVIKNDENDPLPTWNCWIIAPAMPIISDRPIKLIRV